MRNEKLVELKNLLKEKKEKNNLNELDQKKINNLEFILNDNNIFFKIDFDTACGILYFLGIDKDKILGYYKELISPESFSNIEAPYTTISNIK